MFVEAVEMPEVRCEVCNRRFAWKPAMAGRKVRCKCGTVMEIPLAPPPREEGYDVVTPHSEVAPAPLPQRKPMAAVVKTEPEPLINFWLPLWLIGGSVVIDLFIAPLTERGDSHHSLFEIAANILLGVAVMLPAVLLAAKFRGISLGPFGAALLKLAAVSVAPAAAVALASPVFNVIPFGGLVSFAVSFAIYFALLGVFFNLDESDTWYLVGLIFVISVGLYFARLWMSH